LFATFLLGMFWRRTTGHGAFFGLLIGTVAAALFHGCSLAMGAAPGVKGGWLTPLWHFRSEMGQNFYMAIVACATCLLTTAVISLFTPRTKSDAELKGLVYSLTPRPAEDSGRWMNRPVVLGGIILALTLLLNLVFA
jgi:solute:Na+ symporter, SSS family